jgi:YD repeat-containing protein
MKNVLDMSPNEGKVLWAVVARNQDDALLQTHGADWTTKFDYNGFSGRLEGIDVIDAKTQTSVFNMTYTYDPNGAVKGRSELVEGRDEVFHMDGHSRLKEWLLDAGAGVQTSAYTYDAIDNLENVSVSGGASGRTRSSSHTAITASRTLSTIGRRRSIHRASNTTRAGV